MSWNEESIKVVKLTPALCKEFASMQTAPNDRPFSDKRRQFLEEQVRLGKFRTASFASVLCEETGVTYRVNGKHSSTLFAGMNGEFPNDIRCIVERYTAKTLRDVADLFSTFDPQESARKQGDINAAFAGSDPELRDLPRKIINLAVTGISYANWEGNYHGHDSRERAMLSIDNASFVQWLYLVVDNSRKEFKFLRRGSVVAAMFKSFSRSHRAASDFWEEVREASNPDTKSPSRVLNRYLLTTVVGSQRKSSKGADSVDNDTLHAMYVRCLHAWNAYRTSTTTTLKYYPDKPTPAVK
jgi:hypothetical protein